MPVLHTGSIGTWTSGRRTRINTREKGECDGSKSARHAQRFVEVHGIVASHFRPVATCSRPPIIETSAAEDSGFGGPDHLNCFGRPLALLRPRHPTFPTLSASQSQHKFWSETDVARFTSTG